MKQDEIEEENKRKKALIEKTLKERYSQTQQESERLKSVHAELAVLDKLVTRDVEILRAKIEEANRLNNEARSVFQTCDYGLVQCNLLIMDTLGTHPFVLCKEVVLFWRLFCIECIYKGTFKLSFVPKSKPSYSEPLQ